MVEERVSKRKDGKWCGKYKDASGKWKYLYSSSKSEDKAALRAALQDRDAGVVPASKMTMAMLLEE